MKARLLHAFHCNCCRWSVSSSSSSITSQVLIDLFRPPVVSSKVFQVVFIHLVYKSALFLASFCCSFLLRVIANLICIFLVSCQLVLLSPLPKFFRSFCGCSSEKFHLSVNRFLFFLRVQISLPYKRFGRASALYTFILENIWTKVDLKVLFRILSIWVNFAIFCWISFPCS